MSISLILMGLCLVGIGILAAAGKLPTPAGAAVIIGAGFSGVVIITSGVYYLVHKGWDEE